MSKFENKKFYDFFKPGVREKFVKELSCCLEEKLGENLFTFNSGRNSLWELEFLIDMVIDELLEKGVKFAKEYY